MSPTEDPRCPEVLLERVLTTRLLEPHLGPPGRALDLAGGTGPYAVWLTELGWDVSADPVGTFDAVLALGPGCRPTADLARLVRPGGLLAVAPLVEPPHGFVCVVLASTHGFLAGAGDRLEALRLERPDVYRRVLDRLVATASDPGTLRTAGRLLYAGRRRPARAPGGTGA